MAPAIVSEAEPEQPPSPTPNNDSRKRKSQIDEIEVDLTQPEPPSKKAKRLLKKGKPLPAKPQSDDEGESEDGLAVPKGAGKGKGKGGKGEKSKRSDHGIWIGNLPFTLTRVELFKWLVDSSGGSIKEESITRVNLPTSKLGAKERGPGEDAPKKPMNRGFAYVDFDAEAAAVAAMALTEMELDGRKVLIKNSNSFDGRPKKGSEAAAAAAAAATDGNATEVASSRDPKVLPSRKIYVGNLSFQTTEEDLRAHFDRCGDIEWLKVATFEDSGKCKGFGWVKFKEPDAAAWAVKGFVKIKEEIETEDDFRDEDPDADADAEKEERRFKMRKWWVNRLRGRELKIELAEDDRVRYKKRFGKDAPGKGPAAGKGRESFAARNGDGNGNGAGEKARRDNGEGLGEKAEGEKKPAYGDTGVASYLTGAVVKSQGKKTTFD
ncbi:uncharacterized protein GGS25DRAFT_390359 [Hypoxylon fragiforme]|uniref:uncharacterized protein n=1 Tax=Hypoxylon fragiforme TaxID=63214 RepID=UPI0020C69ED9|nr:uncharacterized protein GGS25DRAFT_390359 [Hypoxylon fragiforme]KAI2606434.1 hypothetical protein GGS25DRAFT_390359 [Hypoxylon fragiforme]